METIQPILKRGRDVWDRINMPESEFLRRVNRIRQTLEQEDIDVFLIYGAGLNEYGNICYFTNYITRMPMGAMVIIPKEGEITLLFQGGSRELKAAKNITWVEDTRSSMNLPEDCIKFLQEHHLIPSKVAIAGLKQWMPFLEFQSLMDGVSQCEIIEADDIIRQMRMIKSQKECDQIRRASRMVALGFDFLSKTIVSKPNEKIVEAIIDREMRLEVAEDVRLLFARPMKPQWAMRPAQDSTISEDDRIIVYMALAVERYWAEGIRTFTFKNSCFTKPDANELAKLYETCVGMMKPEKMCSELYKEVLDSIQKSGIGYILDYGFGQGIGLSLQEVPFIDAKDGTQMKEGMCFTMRFAVEDKEVGVVMEGDTFLLAENGPEKLTA